MKAFITITGLKFHFGSKPFEVGQKIKLVKKPDNVYDREAIKAELPGLGCAGYVANSPQQFWATASAPAVCMTKLETVPRPRLSMCWTMQWSAR